MWPPLSFIPISVSLLGFFASAKSVLVSRKLILPIPFPAAAAVGSNTTTYCNVIEAYLIES